VRFGQDFVAAWDAVFNARPLGLGLGVGTNVGANLLRGYREFSLGEGEWQRVILESGAVLGIGFIALRTSMLFVVTAASLKAYRLGRILPLLLVGAGGLDLATGQFGQPTTLGFAVFTAGLAFTAAQSEVKSTPQRRTPAPPPEKATIRGRSAYAERLYGGSERKEER